jgi:hypothetical protein
MVGAPAYYVPLRLWATNSAAVAHPGRLLALGTVFWLVGMGAVLSMVWAGASRRRAVHVAFSGLSLFMLGGAFTTALGSVPGFAVLVGLFGVTVIVIVRLESFPALDVVATWVAMFLVFGPPASALAANLAGASGQVEGSAEELRLHLKTHPDVFVVVVDGYAGQLAMRYVLDFDNSRLVETLATRGYQMPVAWSSYTFTHFSVPSILDMSLPGEDGPVSGETDGALGRMMSGENRLVNALRSEGYVFTMIEAGWGGSRCGEEVDECVSGPFYDDAVAAVMDSTVLAPLVRRLYGDPFTQGSLHTMSWLEENAAWLGRNGRPDLVFAHVLAPHHPYLLDENCGVVARISRVTSDSIASSKLGYLTQLRCVNRFLDVFSAVVPAGAVVVLTADHGSEVRRQLSRPPEQWTLLDRVERMNVFLAVRVPGGCELKDPVLLPGVMARVLSCLSQVPVASPESRMFYVSNSIREIPAADVRALLELR